MTRFRILAGATVAGGLLASVVACGSGVRHGHHGLQRPAAAEDRLHGGGRGLRRPVRRCRLRDLQAARAERVDRAAEHQRAARRRPGQQQRADRRRRGGRQRDGDPEGRQAEVRRDVRADLQPGDVGKPVDPDGERPEGQEDRPHVPQLRGRLRPHGTVAGARHVPVGRAERLRAECRRRGGGAGLRRGLGDPDPAAAGHVDPAEGRAPAGVAGQPAVPAGHVHGAEQLPQRQPRPGEEVRRRRGRGVAVPAGARDRDRGGDQEVHRRERRLPGPVRLPVLPVGVGEDAAGAPEPDPAGLPGGGSEGEDHRADRRLRYIDSTLYTPSS